MQTSPDKNNKAVRLKNAIKPFQIIQTFLTPQKKHLTSSDVFFLEKIIIKMEESW